jgi:hypothetical protein
VPVPQQRDLRLARGAAGEQPDGDLLGVGVAVDERLGHRHPLTELGAGHHGQAVDAGEPVDARLVGEHQGRSHPAGHRTQPVVGQAVVHRGERHTCHPAGVQQDRDGVGVDADEPDPLGPGLDHDRRRPPGPAEQVGVGDAGGPPTDGEAVAHALGGHLQQHRDVHRPPGGGGGLGN